jgi:hypothetical protein
VASNAIPALRFLLKLSHPLLGSTAPGHRHTYAADASIPARAFGQELAPALGGGKIARARAGGQPLEMSRILALAR